MKRIIQAVMVFLSVGIATQSGLAQGGFMSTYVGASLPVNGAIAYTQPLGILTSIVPDGSGGIYVTSQTYNQVYWVSAGLRIFAVAGNSTAGFSGDGGPAITAQLNRPSGIAMDTAGNFYIADSWNNRIRKVTPGGLISTVAGNGTAGSNGDGGPATSAQLRQPIGIAIDTAGNLFIADSSNNRIRKVSGGVISTVAGNGSAGFGGDGGTATSAQLDAPYGVAVDAVGNLYIGDFNNYRVRKVTAGGVISTVAGNGTAGFSGDDGAATSAQLNHPAGVAVDAAGNFYIADSLNGRIREVAAGGVISTVANGWGWQLPEGVAVDAAGTLYIAATYVAASKMAGGPIFHQLAGQFTEGLFGDAGSATSAKLFSPSGVAVDRLGNLYFSDTGNNRIRKVTANGMISTIAGTGIFAGFSGDGGFGYLAKLNSPEGVAVDVAGNIYFADTGNSRIRKITVGGVISTVAGNGAVGFGGDGGAATSAHLNFPEGVAVDAAGNLYIVDTGNSRIRKAAVGGMINTIAGNGAVGFGGDGGAATSAPFNSPVGIAVDATGNLYVADTQNSRIRKVTTGGMISTVAGDGTAGFGGDAGAATSAQLNCPKGVAVDVAGNLYIADASNERIRRVTAGGVINTIVGSGATAFGGDGALAPSASLDNPVGVGLDAYGNLFIADHDNNRIRKVDLGLDAVLSSSTLLRADFNGDGKSDILLQHSDGSAAILLMNGASVSSSGGLIGSGTGWRVVKVGDLNGDGKSDIVWQNIDGSAAVWLMNGLSAISGGGLIGPGTGWSVNLVGDFDGDGKSDILWQHTDGSAAIWLMSGLSVSSGGTLMGPGTGWSVIQIGDFNGDGKGDVVWQKIDGSAAIWLMDGLNVTSGGGLIGPDTGWSVQQIGDFNGDHMSDIVWQHVDGRAAMWLMNGFNVIGNSDLFGPGTGWSVIQIGDFNGDGKSDLLRQKSDGSSELWMMMGLSPITNGGMIGPNSGWTVKRVGDFNGDGKSDILWQNINGSIAIWLMNGFTGIGGGVPLAPGTGWSPAP